MHCNYPSGNPAPSSHLNPFAGVISPAIHDLFINAIDAILMDCALTMPCRLYFGNCKFIECSNCQGGIYKPGGPIAFPPGKLCPLCHNKPAVPVEQIEDFNLMVIFDSGKFVKMAGVAKYPGAPNIQAQTLCRIELYNKLIKCEKIILDTCSHCYTNAYYKRASAPQLMGIGRQEYIVVLWEKFSG